MGEERSHHGPDDGQGASGRKLAGPYAGAPQWFPRWIGRTVVVVASGPSASEAPLHLIPAARPRAACVAINASHRLVPWADALYACDGAFWLRYEDALAFPGLKVTQTAKGLPGVHKVKVEAAHRSMLFDRFGQLGAGGNSGFQAVNLAAQAGAARIVLVGFDYSLARGVHWHGKHPVGMNNPSERNMARWADDMDRAAPLLASLGVEVLNASPYSSLRAFEKRPLEDCLCSARP